MQKLDEGSHYRTKIKAALYTLRRLRRAKFQEQADLLEASLGTVKEAGRDLEDLEDAIIAPITDRDIADDTMDLCFRESRQELASRGLKAAQEAPYTDIFHSGVGYYAGARIEDQVQRTAEFIHLVEADLPEADIIRVEKVPTLKQGSEDFKAALEAIEQAELKASSARTRLKRVERDLIRLMEKIYGFLIEKVGRTAAERFFR